MVWILAYTIPAKSELNSFQAEVDAGTSAVNHGCPVCGEYGNCIHGVASHGECKDSVDTNQGVYQPTAADQAATIPGKFDAFEAQGTQ